MTLKEIAARDAEWTYSFDNEFGALSVRGKFELVSPREWAIVDRHELLALLTEAREMLKGYASECAECDGKGFMDRRMFVVEPAEDVPCAYCADIRALLAKLEIK